MSVRQFSNYADICVILKIVRTTFQSRVVLQSRGQDSN